MSVPQEARQQAGLIGIDAQPTLDPCLLKASLDRLKCLARNDPVMLAGIVLALVRNLPNVESVLKDGIEGAAPYGGVPYSRPCRLRRGLLRMP